MGDEGEVWREWSWDEGELGGDDEEEVDVVCLRCGVCVRK